MLSGSGKELSISGSFLEGVSLLLGMLSSSEKLCCSLEFPTLLAVFVRFFDILTSTKNKKYINHVRA